MIKSFVALALVAALLVGCAEKGKESTPQQIAAAAPLALEPGCLDKDVVDRERALYRQKTLEEGKPENIVDKIVDGRMNKFYQEVCLLDQVYIRDDKQTIKGLLAAEGKALGDTITLGRFVRINLAEAAPEEAEEA